MAALAASLAIPAVAANGATSANGTTITIGAPITLSARVLVTVPVTVSCSPTFITTLSSEQVTVSIQQASSRGVAGGIGTLFYSSGFSGPEPLFPCDGANHTLFVAVTPPNNGVALPFHNGPAIASANVQVFGFTPTFNSVSDQVTEGPDTVRLASSR
jgi:hypothetical protein